MKYNYFMGLSAGGFHRVAYTEWGRSDAERTIICVHGLTRNSRDFDILGDFLNKSDCRVVCPDIVGRGKSDRLADPTGYGYPQYLSDMTAFLARLDTDQVDWVGTSMGGLIGMMLAAQPNSPIRRLVVNDVGALVPKAALERIASYVGAGPVFDDPEQAEAYLRRVHAPFGPLPDAHWRHLTEHSVRTREDGRLELHYDPAIAAAFTAHPLEDVDLWPVWDAVRCPTLVIRGVKSDLLPADIAAQMAERGPPTTFAEIPECGHAPALMDDEQTTLIRDWLLTA